MGKLQDLTQIVDGTYTYCHRGLTSEFFPNTFFRERGGSSGWIPFSEGTLTDGRSDFVIWDMRTVGGSGVDVIFDLGADYWLGEVSIHHVRLSGYECGLGNVRVSVKAEGETRYHFIASHKRRNGGMPIGDPWLRFEGLDGVARYVCLHLEAAGRLTYESSSIGLVGVELLGLSLAEKRILGSRPRLYSWPRDVAWGGGCFALNPGTAIIASAADRFAAEWLRNELIARFDLALPLNSAHGPAIELVRTSGIEAEGYNLRIQPGGIWVEGDPAGVFYGAITLLQLIEKRAGQLVLPAVSIMDGPLAAIRGLHIYLPSRENIPYFKRLLDVMASLKLNMAVLEVSGGIRYHKHPEINTAWERFTQEIRRHLEIGEPALVGDPDHPHRWQDSMHIEQAGGSFLEQEEVRDLVQYAHQRHITLIPEVQTLSHCYWLVYAYPELSERDDTPYPDTYCPSNPDVYPLVFDLLDEVIEVFNPPAIHIGHDEAWAVGTCPKCSHRSPTDLFAEDITRLHDYLTKRNIQTWMWADTLDPNFFGWSWTRKEIGAFSRSPDTRGLVDFLPKDILAINWNWGHTWSHGENPEALERLIHRAGLSQIFGNFEGAFCENFAGRSRAAGISGAIMPSWVANTENEIGRNGVIHNLIFSANVLWSSYYQERRQETIQEVMARIPDIRSRLQAIPSPVLAAGATFIPISIARHANAPLADPTGALGEYDLRSVPTGDLLLDGVPFCISDPASNGGYTLIAAQGSAVRDRLYPSEVADITVKRRAASLLFLHVASDAADAVLDWCRNDNPMFMGLPHEARQTVAWYRINYLDGASVEVDLRYDEHLTRWNTRFGERSVMPYHADPVWQGNTRDGTPVTLWRFEWINPYPEKIIQSVDLLAADGTDAAVLLLAITVVQRAGGTI